ncbi:MAG: phasin family protein [Pseudomonadota bacterium]|nr:phasin family protein [Pseudomonadota bacterium]
MTAEINPFGDVKKMIEQFKVPGVDMSAIVEARRKDIEALVAANKAASESMEALARKQAEMLTQAMKGMQEAAKGAVGSVGDPAKQTEVVRKAFEKTLSDMRELAEMARSSQSDALAHITKRGTEHLQEIKKLMQPKT